MHIEQLKVLKREHPSLFDNVMMNMFKNLVQRAKQDWQVAKTKSVRSEENKDNVGIVMNTSFDNGVQEMNIKEAYRWNDPMSGITHRLKNPRSGISGVLHALLMEKEFIMFTHGSNKEALDEVQMQFERALSRMPSNGPAE